MNPLKVAYKNSKKPQPAPIKPLSEILIEKWTKRERERAAKMYGPKKEK